MKRDALEQNRQVIISAYESGESTVSLGKKYGVNNAYIYMFLRDECGVKMHEHKKDYEKHKEEAIKMHKEGMSVLAIGEKLGIPRSSMARLGKKWNMTFKSTAVKNMNEHADEIIKLYEAGMGCTLLSKKYDCAETTITKLLQRHDIETGINQRKYHFNEAFFNKIDTPEKAYILGFIYGDGSQDGQHIRISITDLELLEKIKDKMELEIPIHHIKPRKEHYKPQYLLKISSVEMCKDLDRVGAMPAKTFKVKFPTEDQVPEKLIKHFLRGLYDADGTISIQKDRIMTQYIGYVGHGPLILGTNIYIQRLFNFSFNVIKDNRGNNGDIKYIRCTNIHQIIKFLDWLYADSTIHLDRKYQKYLELKSKYPAESTGF